MAGIHTYKADGVPEGAARVILGPEESRHIVKSLRARPGEAVELFDGRGSVWSCRLAEPDAKAAALEVLSRRTSHPPKPTLVLAQAVLKGKGMDHLVRDVTELGAARLAPVLTARAEVRLDEARADTKAGRWKTAAVEALKQSANPHLLCVDTPRPFAAWLESLSPTPGSLRLIASLEAGARPLLEALPRTGPLPEEVLVLIGPEGDFSPEEYAQARAAGFLPVRLAAPVLRAETAALYALSVVDAWRQLLPRD